MTGVDRRVVLATLLSFFVLAGALSCASCASVQSRQPAIPVGYLNIDSDLLDLMSQRMAEMEIETAFALLGEQDGLQVRVDGFDATIIAGAWADSVRAIIHDSPRVIGLIHNHPNGSCVLSGKDIETLYKNPKLRVMMAWCGPGQFGLALRGNPMMKLVHR